MKHWLSVVAVLVALLLPGQQVSASSDAFEQVDLDLFIEDATRKSKAAGKKVITLAAPVRFHASLKRHPEAREMSYVYTALQLGGVDPLPVVEHRMFIESKGGRIMPVYVEKEAVGWINDRLKVDQQARFLGYHLFNYEKGPAILVVGFDQAAD